MGANHFGIHEAVSNSVRNDLRVAAASHVGRVRQNNEDQFRAAPELGLFVVADGMGGHVAGETASRLAVDAVEESIRATSGEGNDPQASATRLTAAITQANTRIAAAGETDGVLRGMATTIVAALVETKTATIAHIGDSRAYLYSNGVLMQITADHSWVADQVRAGVLTDTDAKRHPWRNVLTRAIAGGEPGAVEIHTVSLEAGDRLLLCTDGLSGVLASERLLALAGAEESLEHVCASLIDAANEAGGPDNITVVMVEQGPDHAI